MVSAQPKEFRGGWSEKAPYQIGVNGPGGVERLTGLDIEVTRSVAKRAGYRVIFHEVDWDENVSAVREGRLDFAMAATPEESRRAWAWFTIPYRKETIALVTRKREAPAWQSKDPVDRLKQLLVAGRKLAVMRGFYYGPKVSALLNQAEFSAQILFFKDDSGSLDALLSGTADAFLADQLSAASAAAQANAMNLIAADSDPIYEADLSLMFSKKNVSAGMLADFDTALSQMQSSGEIKRITRHYLIPQLLLITMQTSWFRIFDIIGTIAFAISGVIIARRERYDIVGAYVLAALPAVGGGVMRDLISGRSPIGIIQTPSLLLIVLGTVMVGFLFFTIRDLVSPHGKSRPEESTDQPIRWASTRGGLEISDAIGLATFTIIGVTVALEQGCEPLWLWGPIMAVLTAAGGGVLRDVLRSQADIPTLKGSIYPEIALLWGLVYSLVILSKGPELNVREVALLTVVVMLAAFLSRILVVQFRLRSLFLGRSPPRT